MLIWSPGLVHWFGPLQPVPGPVLKEQSSRIMHTGYSYSCEIVQQAARQVLDLHGFGGGNGGGNGGGSEGGNGGGKCVFLCSGSEAIEYGVRLAQSVNQRPLLMTMADSYFGAYGSAKIRGGEDWFNFDWMACQDCGPNQACDQGCEHWRAIPFERIGGFLLEPGQFPRAWCAFRPKN